MKKNISMFLSLFVCCIIATAQEQNTTIDNGIEVKAQAEQTGPTATIEFEKLQHDFGTIEQGGNGTYEFTFANNGKIPLIISNARGSCGCTVPTWPREPIPPGESEKIKVKYDTKRIGAFTKTVTITSNAASKTQVLTIKGKVEKVEETTFPEKKVVEGATPTATQGSQPR